jgi:hypothetical protein
MMQTLLMALVLWTQAEPPKPPEPPIRPERRDPFEGPRPVQPPQTPGTERRPQPFNPDEVRSWLRENEPETYRRLMALQEEGRRPDVARIFEEASNRMREMNELKQRDPKGYERMTEMRRLERESFTQADAARRAPPEEREAATNRLKETLGKLFDAREEVRVRELAELKRRVEALEKALGERKTNKDKLVERRRKELMGEKIDEDW